MPTRVQLSRSTPEAQGVSSAALLAWLDDVEQHVSELHSVMLLRHGQVIAEGWWAPYAPQHPHMLFSLSKSFTSTAVGMAVAEGRLTVDDYVLSFFPDEAPAAPDANLRAMRVRHLLSMSTGHDQDATGHTRASENWVQAFLSLPVEHVPGTHFCYNTAATYMCSAIVQKLTGEKLLDYLRPRLWQPLGITGAAWECCPRGINVGGSGLSVKTEDIARFGQLYLNKGVWNGRRLLSEDWIAEATAKQVANGENPDSDWNQGYGYQFWRCRRNIFRGDGAFGQYCVVMPEQDAVLAITAGVGDMQAVLQKVWDHLLPAMHPAPLPADPGTQSALTARLSALRHDPPAGDTAAPLVGQVSGRKLLLSPNAMNIKGMQFDFAPEHLAFTYQQGRRTRTIACGLGSWRFSRIAALFSPRQAQVAAGGVWTAPDTLQITLRYFETPFYQTLTCRFTDAGAKIDVATNVKFGPNEPIQCTGHFA